MATAAMELMLRLDFKADDLSCRELLLKMLADRCRAPGLGRDPFKDALFIAQLTEIVDEVGQWFSPASRHR